MKRLLLAVGFIAAQVLAGAAAVEIALGTETGNVGKVIEWRAADGPADSVPLTPVPSRPAGLTVHEWGTFTSVAGPDGHAIEWLPAGGPTDLPCFVAVSAGGSVKVITDAQKGERATRGRIRMETPVIYFYSPKEEVVNVKVSFPRGLISEWYPPATVSVNSLSPDLKKVYPSVTGTIEWRNVTVSPGAREDFPMEAGASHYYAARATDAAPVQVPVVFRDAKMTQGTLAEKFLFYRGVADFEPPITVRHTAEGDFSVTNLHERPIPAVVVFENRGGKIGYSVHRNVRGTVSLNPPALTRSMPALQHDLENILQVEGMYPREARAMVETWKDTWFEQGARVFYIVPAATVDELLPLEVTPRPMDVARAFVGRMEVITPVSQEDVRAAIQKNDRLMLEAYGRFLEPIVDHFLSARLTAYEKARETALRKSVRDSYLAAVTACSKGHSW
jgi:hypothetical protein